jgi:hypothetical protein
MSIDDTAIELVGKGYSTMKFSRAYLIRSAVQEFLSFLKQEQKEKDQWTFDRSGRGDPDDGYISLKGEAVNGRRKDKKEIFHFSPVLISLLSEARVSCCEYQHFLDEASWLYEECFEESVLLAQAFDRELPGYDFEGEIIRARETSLPYATPTLRLASYETDGCGTLRASNHTDRSLFTFQLEGSDPESLYIKDGELFTSPNKGTIRVFLGEKAKLLCPRLNPVWHAVSSTSKDTHWSVVYFAHSTQVLEEGSH